MTDEAKRVEGGEDAERTQETEDTATAPTAADQRRAVRERYGGLVSDVADAADADDEDGDCCGEDESCCDSADSPDIEAAAAMGYTEGDLTSAPSGANLGLGCGNPTAIADMSPGETVLDLGSGAGFDCFLAASAVGPEGRVLGVDMTPAMVERARENAAESAQDHVEFRLGEIEHLPVADASVDVVISNCVVNLSPDKPQVFAEAFRVLRPGGRLAISDVVMTAEIPVAERADPDSVAACVAGASTVQELETMLAEAGFVDVAIEPKAESEAFISDWDPDRDLSEYIVSATIEGKKPER